MTGETPASGVQPPTALASPSHELGLLLPGAARLAAMQQLAAYGDRARSLYLECRMGRAAAPVDLLLSLLPPRKGANQMASGHSRARARHAVVRRLLAVWSNPNSALARVPVVWLEFDRLDVERASEPNVSTCLAPSYSNPLAPVASSGHATTLAIMSETLRVVDARATRAESNALELLVSELPANANWIHFSAMWTRRPRQLKLYGSFPESSLLGYLKTAGWAGDFELLARVLRRYCPRERTNGMLYVDLPVTGMRDAQRAALGISFSQQHLRLACERDPQWTALLTELCAARVCTRERARAVQAWLRSAPGAPGPRKWLDIKLILKPQRSLEAKAYLGVGGSLLA